MQLKSQISRLYCWLGIINNLCRPGLGGQTVKILRRLAYEFELDSIQRKSAAIGCPTETKTCVDLRTNLSSTRVNASQRKSAATGCPNENLRWLASPFCQGFTQLLSQTRMLSFVRGRPVCTDWCKYFRRSSNCLIFSHVQSWCIPVSVNCTRSYA